MPPGQFYKLVPAGGAQSFHHRGMVLARALERLGKRIGIRPDAVNLLCAVLDSLNKELIAAKAEKGPVKL